MAIFHNDIAAATVPRRQQMPAETPTAVAVLVLSSRAELPETCAEGVGCVQTGFKEVLGACTGS